MRHAAVSTSAIESPAAAGREHGEVSRRPARTERRARARSSVPSASSVMRSPGRAGATDIAAAGDAMPGARQQPAGEQRLGERDRRREPAGDAQHREPVGQAGAGAAVLVPAPRQASARHRPAPARAVASSRHRSGAIDGLRIGEVRKDPRPPSLRRYFRSRSRPLPLARARIGVSWWEAAALASRAGDRGICARSERPNIPG